MKASKQKKKLRWLEQESRNRKRASVVRNMARAQASKIRRKGGGA